MSFGIESDSDRIILDRTPFIYFSFAQLKRDQNSFVNHSLFFLMQEVLFGPFCCQKVLGVLNLSVKKLESQK